MARLKFNKNRMKSSILFSTLSSRFTSQIKKKKKSEYKREELKVSQRLNFLSRETQHFLFTRVFSE